MTDQMYGTHALEFDEAKHSAGWGARLIFAEVFDGGQGVVHNRQSWAGGRDEANRLLATYPAFLDVIRKVFSPYDSGSDEVFKWSPPGDPAIEWVASPQKSYGYLYVKGVVAR